MSENKMHLRMEDVFKIKKEVICLFTIFYQSF